MQYRQTARVIRTLVAFVLACALGVLTCTPPTVIGWSFRFATPGWAQEEPLHGDESSAPEVPAPDSSAEGEASATQADVALAQQIHDLLEQRDREAMDDMARMSQTVAEELDGTLTTYRNDAMAILNEFALCIVRGAGTPDYDPAAQCAACRQTANAEVLSKLEVPWAQMEDRYIKLQADIDARVDRFEGVRDEARLVFGLEAGDPIDQTVDQAVTQRAAVLRAFKPREVFEASYGKISPFAVNSIMICPLG